MLARLFLLFTLLPVVEIVLLVWIARETSIWIVLALVVGLAIVGAVLARGQGLKALSRIPAEIQAGRAPADAVLDAMLIFLAGVLLILPGFLSDVMAVVLLVPVSRQLVKRMLRRKFAGQLVAARFATFDVPPGRDEVIDIRVIDGPPRELPG